MVRFRRLSLSFMIGILGILFFINNLLSLGSISNIESLVNAYIRPINKKNEILNHYLPFVKETQESVHFEMSIVGDSLNLDKYKFKSQYPIKCLYIPADFTGELHNVINENHRLILINENYQLNKSHLKLLKNQEVINIGTKEPIFIQEPKRPVFFELGRNWVIQNVFMSYSKTSRNNLYLNAI